MNATVAIYSITSGLHDEAAVKAISDEFLGGIFGSAGDSAAGAAPYLWKGADFSDFGSEPLSLIYVRTGGAEGIFKNLLPGMLEKGAKCFYLLTSGKSNSLAASLEILSYLRQRGLKGEVLHGGPEYLRGRIGLLAKVEAARRALAGQRIGILGHPSDWLISSTWDDAALKERLGLTLDYMPMEEVLAVLKDPALLVPGPFSRATDKPFAGSPDVADAFDVPEVLPMSRDIRASFPGAVRIYRALKSIIAERGLGALTLRCFDLLGTVHNTGCDALAQLNSEGIPSSCEGDVPALLSMMVAQALTGCTGFQANPARIDVETGEMLFAHCTIPFNIVEDCYCYDTHFESGIGVGIHGHFPIGPVTVFKLSGSLDRAFIAEGEALRNQKEPDLCRTQVWLRLRPEDARYFLTDPIGNHHILIPGHHGTLLAEFIRTCCAFPVNV